MAVTTDLDYTIPLETDGSDKKLTDNRHTDNKAFTGVR